MKNFVKSKKFKNFMAKLYGWGASIVIVGALFKIQHWPFAGVMLTVGLGTEALIFFFSAFEPPHVEPDWSLVYPELAGMLHEDDEKVEKKSLTEEIDKMLEESKIGPELIKSLGEGMKNLSDNTSKLNDITKATVATDEYTQNIKVASKSANDLSISTVELASSYKQASDVIKKDVAVNEEYVESVKNITNSAKELTSTYSKTAQALNSDMATTEEYVNTMQKVAKSASDLNNKYLQSAETITKSVEVLSMSSNDVKSFNDQVNKVSKNLEALNSVYELQIKGNTAQVESINKIHTTVEQFLGNLGDSNQYTLKYKDEVASLTKNIAALNSVYGNMLAAMNVNLNK